MLLIRLALNRGASTSRIPLSLLNGSIFSRQRPSSQPCSFYSALTKSKVTAPLMQVGCSQGRQSVRLSSDWMRRADTFLQDNKEMIVTFSVGAFLLYFLMLRRPSDIDEYLSRPIWERLPGIDPEMAERMMEVDTYLGLQVDKTGLEEYKKKYYGEKLEELEQEAAAMKKHEELKKAVESKSRAVGSQNTSGSHFRMLQEIADRQPRKD